MSILLAELKNRRCPLTYYLTLANSMKNKNKVKKSKIDYEIMKPVSIVTTAKSVPHTFSEIL